jgi:hypothetical protein
MRSRGIFGHPSGAFDESLGSGSLKRGAAEDPRPLGQRMKGLDLGTFRGKA